MKPITPEPLNYSQTMAGTLKTKGRKLAQRSQDSRLVRSFDPGPGHNRDHRRDKTDLITSHPADGKNRADRLHADRR